MTKNTVAQTRRLIEFDKSHRPKSGLLCGVDEAGRGPIAGPVVAAAVIFTDDAFIDGVMDSKQVVPNKREKLYDEIFSSAVSVGIGIIDSGEIDRINILRATELAMDKAISKMKFKPEKIIADGNFYGKKTTNAEDIVKADEKSFSVAAASIIAKVTRDRIMRDYEKQFPNYSFSEHKGYCTRKHIEEILEYGYSEIHRRSFSIKAIQMELDESW